MGKKTLIPEEKWEGLRHAMEEAAGTRKPSKTPGLLLPTAEGEGKKERKGEKEKEKKKKKEKEKKKGKKEKGKKKKNGKKKKKGKG